MTSIADRLAALRKPSNRTIVMRSDLAVSPDFKAILDNWTACSDRLTLAVELLRARERPHGSCPTSACSHCDAVRDTPIFLAHLDKERA